MTITTSPDITQLSVQVTFDISGNTPSVSLVNLSEGSGLANLIWWFIVLSPSGTFIHEGSETSPDKTGNWSTDSLNDAWPRPFNQIEFSGAAYSFQVFVKDSNGAIFYDAPQTAFICRPAGNTQASKNTFGIAASVVSVKCQEARIYFEDVTYHSYKGSDGTRIGSTLRVIYPIDETATIPTPFAIANYSTALVPISYSSNNYQFLQQDIYDYDLGNNTLVRIKYQIIQTFAVWCNIDLEPLVCEFNKLIEEVQNGNCLDVSEANRKLILISPKMFLVFMGIMQPLTGIDVPAIIEEIKVIGGFDCDCCSAATGIIPQTSSVIDGYNFIVNPVCGDINGTVTSNGTNITFNLQDISYIVTVCNESPSETTAFRFIQSQQGCQKTYCLKIDANQLAYDILNTIKNDIDLVNLFNSIVNNGGGSNLLVDGKCIFQTSTSCNYTFDVLNVPVSTTFAILTGINSSPINFAFNQTNLPALQAYLNTLGLGTFAVTNPTSGEVLISSTANTHNLLSLTYSAASTNYIAAMTRDCTGYVPITASAAVQNIIDYLCGITDAEIETSQDYEICYIDPVTKSVKTVTVSSGAAVSDFLTELLARGCDTVNYIIGLGANTCVGVQNLFPQSPAVMQSNDYVLGTKAGDCARVFPVELGTTILQNGIFNADFMTAFCAAVAACGAGLPCAPFNYFYLTVPYSSPTDDTMDIIVNFQNTAAASYILRYARIDNTNTPTYVTIPSVISSPYVIDNVADGQYTVGLTPIYSDGRNCPEVTQTTPPCTGINSFSVVAGGSPSDSFVISYSAIVGLPKIRVNISYPNGGSSSAIYTNNGVDITIPFPTGVYGTFSLTITPVCNENTGYFGAATAPVLLTVNPPGGAINYTLEGAYNFSITGVTGTGVPALPATGTTGSQQGHHTVMSGNYNITVAGSVVTATKLVALVNGVLFACIAVTAAGTYVLSISAMEADDVEISINSGVC